MKIGFAGSANCSPLRARASEAGARATAARGRATKITTLKTA
jgi:hypothetical protein